MSFECLAKDNVGLSSVANEVASGPTRFVTDMLAVS